jgi:rhodanese-related sulfurtransferase
MIILALALAALALLLALVALGRASSFARRIEEAELASKRRGENLAEEFERASTAQRELLARVAAGVPVSREMILEGRLWEDVDGARARELVAAGARLLDVRTSGETAGGVLPGALLVPIDALEARVGELPRDPRSWVVYCSAGSRSAAACEFLSQAGFVGLHNLAGGIGAFGGATERPR